MALVTLPYPSMDFTPLDILTADELDQIVANYEAINNAIIQTANIANLAISTTKIANKAVTEAKIQKNILTAAISNSGDAGYAQGDVSLTVQKAKVGSLLTLTGGKIVIPSGVSKVYVSGSVFYHSIGQATYGWWLLRQNSSTLLPGPITNIGSNNYGTAVLPPTLVSVSAGDGFCIFNNEAGVDIRGSDSWLTVEVVE